MDYNDQKAFGRLCKPLCLTGDISAISCEPMHKGKLSVFTALWNDTLVVIKSHRIKSDYIPLQWTNPNASETFPNYQELTEMVRQSLQVNFGLHKQPDDFMDVLYPFLGDQPIHRDLMINLWQLSQDNEYVTLSMNRQSNMFPKILASCGTFYAVEYAKPLSKFNIFSDDFNDFHSRVRQAKLILQLVDGLQHSKPDPIRMCDVKLEHFGSIDGRQVLLDADTVFPQPIVDRSVADGRQCSRHSDCDLFDCRSICNQILNVCDTPAVNNNLQIVCQKIFLDAGLLISRHLPAGIERLLKECADPDHSHGRQAAPVHLHVELASYFNEFLQITNRTIV